VTVPNAVWRGVFDRRAIDYEGSHRTSAHVSLRYYRGLVEKLFRGSRGGAVLDAGCGVGSMTELLARSRPIVGVDFSLASAGYARRRGLFAVAGDVLQLPLRDRAFERVASIGVLQHFEDARPMLRELHRVTRPGGELLLVTTNAQCLSVRLHLFVQRLFRRPPAFTRLYSAREIFAAAAAAGFQPAKPLTALQRHVLPAIALRLARPEAANV